MTKQKKALILINPYSGQKLANTQLLSIIELFSKAGYFCSVCPTDPESGAKNSTVRHAKGTDLIVCIGGDGTLSEVMSGLYEVGIKKPIGYIPSGSTNDFANSAHLSKNIMTAARDIVDGTKKPFDIGLFNGRCFSYVASFGIFSATSYNTPQELKNTLGHLAYVLSGIKELGNIKPYHVRAETDAGTFEGDYIFGSISNSTSIAGIVALDPNRVRMDDGRFEMMLIKMPQNIIELSLIVSCLSNQTYDPSFFDYASVGRAVITASKEMEWSLDGEYASGKDEIQFEVLHHAVDVIVKKDALTPLPKDR